MADEHKIADLMARYEAAMRAADAQGCADCYEEHTEYVTAGMAPVTSRQGMVDLHQEIFEGEFQLKDIVTDETIVSGDLAYVRQTVVSEEGRSFALLVLRRQPDGGWLVHAEAEVVA